MNRARMQGQDKNTYNVMCAEATIDPKHGIHETTTCMHQYTQILTHCTYYWEAPLTPIWNVFDRIMQHVNTQFIQQNHNSYLDKGRQLTHCILASILRFSSNNIRDTLSDSLNRKITHDLPP